MMWTLAQEPLRLWTGNPAHDLLPVGWSDALWIGGAILAIVALVGAHAMRWWLSRPHAERAFHAIARELALTGTDRGIIVQLAALAGVHPVAMLVSKHSFATACEQAIHASPSNVSPESLAVILDKMATRQVAACNDDARVL